MFNKDASQLGGGYTNTQVGGTEWLRNTLRTTVYSGNETLESILVNSQLYWKFYNNRHWGKNNDELLSFNYVRAVIDKVNNFIIGKDGFEINVFDTYGDKVPEEVETVYEALINYNWRKNKKKTFLQNMLQMGSVTGNAYLFLEPKIVEGFVEYMVLDSRNTIPIFKDGDFNMVEGYRSIVLLHNHELKYIQKVMEYSALEVTTYYVKETGEKAERFSTVTTPNIFGFIPIIHIENIPMSDSYGGKSDMEDIVKINKAYNEGAEDIKNIISYYAAPTTVITGGTVGQLKRGINQIWSGLPADASVTNLTLGEDLSASNTFLKMLKDAMHDLSGVPEEVLSKVQHISNTSAAALQMLYQPIIQVADKKCVSYGEGMEELHRMTMVIYSKILATHPLYLKMPAEALKNMAVYAMRVRAEVVWKYNLPNDRMGMLNEATIELTSRLGSRREIMERLGKKNIPKIEAEIQEDIKMAVDFEKAIMPEPSSEPPKAQE